MRTNTMGVPYVSLALCSAFCCLACVASRLPLRCSADPPVNSYLNVSTSSKQVFTYFVALVTVFGALTWMSILYS
jgi:amino acid transporter